MFNQMQCIGNLCKDGELRYAPSGSAIYTNSIATTHKWKDQTGQQKEETMFMDIVMFGRSGEIGNQFLKRGSKVFLQGRVVLEKWTAQDGSNRSKHVLRVDTMKMLDSKSDNQDKGYQQGNSYQSQNNYSQPQQDNGNYDIPDIDINMEEVLF